MRSSFDDAPLFYQYSRIWNCGIICPIDQCSADESKRLRTASGNSFRKVGKSGHIVRPGSCNKSRECALIVITNSFEMIEFSVNADFRNQVLLVIKPKCVAPLNQTIKRIST